MAKNSLLINVDIGETRVALIEDGIVGELHVERNQDRSPVGNIYVGKVTRVLPGMQAAFVDIGLDRAAFLHVEDLLAKDNGETVENKAEASPKTGKDASQKNNGRKGKASKSMRRNRVSRDTPIREVLSEGQEIVVQVSKGSIGTKGARITSHVSMLGRYVVYMPTVNSVGVSKRIGGEKERARLKEVLESIKPEKGGVIVRTLAQGLTTAQLKADIDYLVSAWHHAEEAIEKAKKTRRKKKAPYLVYQEPNLVLRTARDMFSDNVDEIVIDDRRGFDDLQHFAEANLKERTNDIRLYEGSEPLFDEYGIESEIARALSRKVPLPSGGYLIIDQAEALTAIDVNTGRFTGKGKDVEQTIFQTNLEAVRELAYQLRFRNIGGLIVVDFIDMEKQSHRNKVYRELLRELKNDSAKTSAVRISELGLVEMTRKRTHESIGRTMYEPCFYCDGTGQLKSKPTICHEIFRQLSREKDWLPGYSVTVSAHPAICDMLKREERVTLQEAEKRFQRRIELQPRADYHLEQFDLTAS